MYAKRIIIINVSYNSLWNTNNFHSLKYKYFIFTFNLIQCLFQLFINSSKIVLNTVRCDFF